MLVVAVVGAGGAWMALKGGAAKANGVTPDSSAVSRDTARVGGRSDTTTRANRPPSRPSVSVAHARDALDDLFLEKLTPATAAMVRDSALRFYTATGISEKDQGYAAFVVGQAYFQLRDRATGCRYVRTASAIDPGDATYSRLLEQCS